MIRLQLILTLILISNRSLVQNIQETCLNWHNAVRKNLIECKYPNQPKPKYMPMLIWDNELTIGSQLHAEKCVLEHSHDSFLGENLVLGSSAYSLEGLMNAWLAEKEDYVFSNHTCLDKKCVHYTQFQLDKMTLSHDHSWGESAHDPSDRAGRESTISGISTSRYPSKEVVWAGSTLVGCGAAKCPNGTLLVCRYHPPSEIEDTESRVSNNVPLKCQTTLSIVVASQTTIFLTL